MNKLQEYLASQVDIHVEPQTVETGLISSESSPGANNLDDSQHKPSRKHSKTNILKCKYFVERKKRRCQLVAMKDQDYCAEHFLNNMEDTSDNRRIPCPFDPKHSCRVIDLKSHKRRCNMRPRTPPPYYSKNFNLVSAFPFDSSSGKKHAFLNEQEFERLVLHIYSIYKSELNPPIQHTGLNALSLDEIGQPGFGHSAQRHLRQTSSLLKILQVGGMFKDNTVFIEFGSGKGLISYYLAQSVCENVREPKTCKYLLIDRESHRHKRDNKLKDTDNIDIERIRIDLADLVLGNVDSVANSQHIVGISKHLCGAAIDLALSCLLGNNSKVENVEGFVMATCCHHRCTWESYVGKKYLLALGFKPDDFGSLAAMSSWAVSGTGTETFSGPAMELDLSTADSNTLQSLNKDQKRSVGIWVKRILDQGRINFVQSFLSNAYLATYVDLADTLENIAIVARRCSSDLFV